MTQKRYKRVRGELIQIKESNSNKHEVFRRLQALQRDINELLEIFNLQKKVKND